LVQVTVLDGDPAPPPQKGTELPIFSPCLLWPNGWMDQDDTWHGGGPQSRPHCARWGPSYLPQKGGRASIFDPFLLWPNCWVHQDATCYGGRPQPSRLCVTWRPSFPSPKMVGAPNFRPMSIMATVTHLTYC